MSGGGGGGGKPDDVRARAWNSRKALRAAADIYLFLVRLVATITIRSSQDDALPKSKIYAERESRVANACGKTRGAQIARHTEKSHLANFPVVQYPHATRPHVAN